MTIRAGRVLASIVLLGLSAHACAEGQVVHRCVGVHGEVSFTAAPCGEASLTTSPESTSTSSPGASGPTAMCPASEDALRDIVAAAFDRHDANGLAGILRWDGVGGGAARSRLRDLADLAARPLLGIDIETGVGGAPDEPVPAAVLAIHIDERDGGGGEERDFAIVFEGGCYWLDW